MNSRHWLKPTTTYSLRRIKKGGPWSMVLIQPRLPEDEDYDPMEVVVLPKAIHNLCWAIAEHPDDESAGALVLALQARYHPLLHRDHVTALVYEISDDMLRTAEDVGFLLLISGEGVLHALISEYPVYYAIDEWRIVLPEGTAVTETLADAIEYTAKLRSAEKRRKPGSN